MYSTPKLLQYLAKHVAIGANILNDGHLWPGAASYYAYLA